jgi:hypothetical protein
MFERVMPITSICRHSPVLAFQVMTVSSYDAGARRVESYRTDVVNRNLPSAVKRVVFCCLAG